MRINAALIAAVMSFGVVAPLPAQSLADLARQEQDRRKTVKKPSKVLTNKDLGSAPAPPPASAETATPDASGTAPATAGGDKPTADAEKKPEGDGAVKDQAYWSTRTKELQTQISRNETFAVALQSRINALANEYTNQGDGVRQQAIAVDRQKTVEELNRLTKQIADDKQAFADLQEEARQAGVPSGWLR